MTALEALMAAIREVAPRTPAEEAEARARSAAGSLGCVALLTRRLPELSQGQLRLVLLGRALARDPALLLLDEYLDGLDSGHRRRLDDVLAAYAARGTVIFATHRPESVPDWCAGRAWMRDGRLFAGEPPAGAAAAAALDARHPFRSAPVGTEGGAAPPIFDLARVSVYIDRRKVLHDITWQLRPGEHWRISGPNGSGKSTLLRLLAGDEFAAAGGRLTRFLPSLGRGGATLEAGQQQRHLPGVQRGGARGGHGAAGKLFSGGPGRPPGGDLHPAHVHGRTEAPLSRARPHGGS